MRIFYLLHNSSQKQQQVLKSSEIHMWENSIYHMNTVEEPTDKEKMKNCDTYDSINSDWGRYDKSLNVKTPQKQEKKHFLRRSLIVGNKGGRLGFL